MSAALACPPGDEVEREALCHIVKEKWPEEAVFQAQDAVYEKMDCAEETLNSGLSRLAVMALVRATCQRPGAMGKDAFDIRSRTR